MVDFLLLSTSCPVSFNYIFNDIWNNAYYWRYMTIIAIFLMILYKRKVSYYEKLHNRIENDKNIIRRAGFIYPEIDLKDLMKSLINNSSILNVQFDKLKEFEKYLSEKENNLVSESLKKAVGEVLSTLRNTIEFIEKEFVQDIENGLLKINTNANMDKVDEFELHDKIFKVVNAFESKYLSYIQEVKDEFI